MSAPFTLRLEEKERETRLELATNSTMSGPKGD